MFVGREKELIFWRAVRVGRRRADCRLWPPPVGKTETLRKFCEGSPTYFIPAQRARTGSSLPPSDERVLRLGGPAAKYITTFSSWIQAFENIADLGREGKAVIVIDEFPYMMKGRMGRSRPFYRMCGTRS